MFGQLSSYLADILAWWTHYATHVQPTLLVDLNGDHLKTIHKNQNRAKFGGFIYN